MSAFAIDIDSGKTVKLPTAGKYCDRDIVITATGSDAFWDAYQNNGDVDIRRNYRYAFYSPFWNDSNFKPKYNIVPSKEGQYMFQNCGVTDLKGILQQQGVILDLSATPNLYYCFASAKITRLPELNCGNCSNFQNMFVDCADLLRIEKITISEKATGTAFMRMFGGCTSLRTVIFDGVINGDIAINESPLLSHDSIMSLLNALKANGTGTITLGETNLAKLTDAEKAIATEKGWTLV